MNGKNQVSTGIGVHTRQNGNLSVSKLICIEGGAISSDDGDSGMGTECITTSDEADRCGPSLHKKYCSFYTSTDSEVVRHLMIVAPALYYDLPAPALNYPQVIQLHKFNQTLQQWLQCSSQQD